jgi:hypothetical protein
MILKKLGVFAAAVSVLFTSASLADTLEVKENHPTKYVVQKGDTLWDISAKFLKKPWYWPKIWHVNPQVDDPHWIYPGDVLTLVWIDGKPYLQRATEAPKGVAPVQTIKADAIKSFLKNDTILPADDDKLALLPFVLGNNEGRSIMAETHDIYVRGKLVKGQQYGIYKKGDLLKDEEGNSLGYKAQFVGVLVAGAEHPNDVNKSYLVKNITAVQQGNYVMPFNDADGYSLYFTPKAATVDATVVGLAVNGSVAGRFDTVILSKGSNAGVKVGDVYSITSSGQELVGSTADDIGYATMTTMGEKLVESRDNILPDQELAQAMVYRTYDNVSMAVIMVNTKHVEVGNKAVKPE